MMDIETSNQHTAIGRRAIGDRSQKYEKNSMSKKKYENNSMRKRSTRTTG